MNFATAWTCSVGQVLVHLWNDRQVVHIAELSDGCFIDFTMQFASLSEARAYLAQAQRTGDVRTHIEQVFADLKGEKDVHSVSQLGAH